MSAVLILFLIRKLFLNWLFPEYRPMTLIGVSLLVVQIPLGKMSSQAGVYGSLAQPNFQLVYTPEEGSLLLATVLYTNRSLFWSTANDVEVPWMNQEFHWRCCCCLLCFISLFLSFMSFYVEAWHLYVKGSSLI